MSRLREWSTVTVASACGSFCRRIAAIGLPTMLPRPRTTTSAPFVSTPLRIRSSWTPAGVHELLIRTGVPLSGAEVVILGRGNIVGKPMAAILLQKEKHADATVTLLHSRSKNIAEHCRRADILIAAMGQAHFVKADMVKPGAVVIDVGVNRVDDPQAKKGYRLVGDVDFDAVREVAGAITPNPGGVGPMTIAMLLANTVRAAGLTAH